MMKTTLRAGHHPWMPASRASEGIFVLVYMLFVFVVHPMYLLRVEL